MPLDIGQTVAACVPYTKRRLEWIMAVTQGWNEEEEFYIVKDLYPDKKKRVHTWKVPPTKVIPFPAKEDERFERGSVVLSLWLESGEWSSMFYKAVVARSLDPNENFIEIQYEGDPTIHRVNRTKVVHFQPLAKPRARTRMQRALPPVDADDSEDENDSSGEMESDLDSDTSGNSVRNGSSDMEDLEYENPVKKIKLAHPDLDHDALATISCIYSSSLYRPEASSPGRGVLEKKMLNMYSILAERYNLAT